MFYVNRCGYVYILRLTLWLRSLRFTLWLRQWAFYASYIIRSTSRSTFYSTYRHVNRWIFSRDAGRTKSKPVDARSRSFMSMCLLWLQRSRSSPGRAGVYEWNTHSRPAKLATNLTPSPVCFGSDLALRSLDDCVAVMLCDE